MSVFDKCLVYVAPHASVEVYQAYLQFLSIICNQSSVAVPALDHMPALSVVCHMMSLDSNGLTPFWLSSYKHSNLHRSQTSQPGHQHSTYIQQELFSKVRGLGMGVNARDASTPQQDSSFLVVSNYQHWYKTQANKTMIINRRITALQSVRSLIWTWHSDITNNLQVVDMDMRAATPGRTLFCLPILGQYRDMPGSTAAVTRVNLGSSAAHLQQLIGC
jgi:hypothetical protein